MAENENNNEVCETNVIHVDIVEKVKDEMPDEEELYDLSDLFKVFGDSTRIKIICALFKAEMCVCDIAYLLQMKQSAISHQLKVLRQAKLVKYRRDGKVVYYSLDDEHIKGIFNMGFMHINEKR
ncbi:MULTISPECIES: ArsR/SmtB family transcription factor [Clostridium]|uniref:ArsR/SmtB family transcription factor n=1 Tax=Clostridium TaxID=1485 RepID=UPI0008265312|nr:MULTISPECIES: metalloregulator ArsR/SmtB family transcription factor [Clostridium]PJI09794.1 ArsR family transcriptional regulator [Clostridium sp. CT7]